MASASTVQLTTRDREILDTLTRCVRVLTVAQVARTWWRECNDPHRGASQRVKSLEIEGLVERLQLMAHTEVELAGPLLKWKPGESQPDFGAASYRLRSRWTGEPVTTNCVIATESAGAWLGGTGGRRPRPSEATHDIHLAGLYLKLRETKPIVARTWTSEATLYRSGEGRGDRLPDAIAGNRRRRFVIEFGGAYSKPKLAEFHDYCARRGLPYEVW